MAFLWILGWAVLPALGQPTVDLEHAEPNPPPLATAPVAGSTSVVEVGEIAPASTRTGTTVSRVEPADSSANTPKIASDVRAAIATLVSGWSQAWSRQQTEEYLGYYSEEFQLPGLTDRATWEQRRRQRIERPQFVEVAVAILDAELMHNDRAKVRFLQRYRSDVYQDVVIKTLELVTEEDGWKILRETVEEQP